MTALPWPGGGIFGPMGGLFEKGQPTNNFWSLLANLGGGMLSANRPGANFSQALGGGIQQAMQGPQMLQDMAMRQQLLDIQRERLEGDKEERQMRRDKFKAAGESETALDNYILANRGLFEPMLPNPGLLDVMVQAPNTTDLFKPYMEPKKQPEQPSEVREYEFAKAQGYTGSFMDFQLAQKGTDKPTDFQQKVSMLMQRGLSRTQAEDLAAGYVRPYTDPLTGQPGSINLASNAAAPASAPAGTQSGLPVTTDMKKNAASLARDLQAMLNQEPQLRAAIEKGVGAGAVMTDFANRTLGQIPGMGNIDIPLVGKVGIDPEVTAARTRTKAFKERLIKLLAKDGRVPVTEQQRILSLLPSEGFFESPMAANAALDEVFGMLRQYYGEAEATLTGQPPPRLGSDPNALRSMSDDQLLRELGVR